MGIDWDVLVGSPVTAIFGESAQYACARGPAFPIDANFTEGFESQPALDEGASLTTTRPTFGVQLSAFPAGYAPLQGDRLTALNPVTRVTEVWEVKEVQIDGQGTAYLAVNQVA